jgi:hypothetical protein
MDSALCVIFDTPCSAFVAHTKRNVKRVYFFPALSYYVVACFPLVFRGCTMDSERFFSVANETYPLLRQPQSSVPKKTLFAGISLLIGDMQMSTKKTLAREAALQEWARLHAVRTPEHATGVVLDGMA